MKRKILLFCLCFCAALSQSLHANKTANYEHITPKDGIYTFSQATLVIFNFETKQEVERVTITDPALIDSANFHFQNIFMQITVYKGVITNCILPDEREYTLEDNILLENNEKEQLLPDSTSDRKYEQGRSLSPYNLTTGNNNAIIEFLYPFGDSRYHFALEAKLTVILTKQ